MPVITKAFAAESWATPRLDLGGCVLNLPLWHPTLGVVAGGSFQSKDKIGHACDVTGTVWAPQGRTFDGTNDQIALPATILDGLVNATVEMWVSYEVGDDYPPVFECRKDGNNRILFYFTKSNAKFGWEANVAGVPVGISSNAGFTESLKYHVIMLMGVGGAQMYVNGVIQTSTSASTACFADMATATTLIIGSDSGSVRDFKGGIGELRVYDRKLNVSQRHHNSQATKWRYQ